MSMNDDRPAGLALDGTTLTVVWRSARDKGAWRWESRACDATPTGIACAIAELGRDIPVNGPLSVTLRRPLASARTLTFPTMARAALERVLTRDWTRHVIGMRATAHTAAVRQIARNQWRAAFAPKDTLDAITEVAAEHGWRDLTVQTSDDALAAVIRAPGTGQRSASDLFIFVCDCSGPTDAIYLRNGEPSIGRRFLAGAGDEDALAFVEAVPVEHAFSRRLGKAQVIVIGSPDRAATLAQRFSQHEHHARVLDIGVGGDVPDLAVIAVAGTYGASTLPLLSSAAQGARTREMRNLTRWLTFTTAAALMVAFALERWGVASAMAAVQQRRADIATQVRNAVGARTDLEGKIESAAALAEHEAAASHASGVIAAVAVALPPATSLTTLSVAGDSVTIEGESKRSAAVYDALRGIASLERIKLAAPLRQERQAGDATVERIAFGAHVRALPRTAR